MQEKKNKRLLISLIGLTLMIIGFYFLNNRGNQIIVDTSLFKPSEGAKIDRVLLESTSGTVKLEFNGTRWMVNDKFDANQQLIKLLLATLERAEPKRPVSINQQDSASALLSKGVDVKIFEGESLLQSFKAGGNEQKTEAYFQKSSGDPTYVMIIPGYRLYVSYILELDENGWRDKRIFNFNWRNFKSLHMTMFNDPSQNFEVSFKDQYFGVTGLASVDTTKLNDYLDAVSLLSADQLVAPGFSASYDSLLKTKPTFRVEVKDIADKTYLLDLFMPLKNDPNVLGNWGGEEPVIFNRSDILPIARKRDYFIAR